MTNNQKLEMYAKIERHGNNLLAIFPAAKISDPVKLCKALRRMETKAHAAATHYCNGDVPMLGSAAGDDDYWHNLGQACADKAAAILGASPVPCLSIFFNGDAREYALKIRIVGDSQEDGAARFDLYKDWGGYGIIAPDFFPAE